MNKVILIGRVGKTPECKKLDFGNVCNFTLATDESYKKDGQKVEKTQWHNINAKLGLADFCEKYVAKGSRVIVEGKISSREYEKDGEKKTFFEVIAQSVTPIDWPEKKEERVIAEGSNVDEIDLLPF
jgi:single-strand DNA-binding protein